MATTKRPKRAASSTPNRRTASATPNIAPDTTAAVLEPEASSVILEAGDADLNNAPTLVMEAGVPIASNAVILEAGDADLNDAPTLTLPVVQNDPEPEFVPPAAEPPAPAPAATGPTIAQAAPANFTPLDLPPAPATPPSLTPTEERAAYMRRRLIALAGLVVVLLIAGFIAYRFLGTQTAAAPSVPAAPPAQIAAPGQAAPPAAPPAAQADVPPAAPAAPPAAGVAATCTPIQGLPVFAGASCTEFDRDEDDGQVKLKNTYVVNVPAADVNRFYEDAFKQNGWTVAKMESDLEDGQWEYTITQGAREIDIKIEAQESAQGNVTEFKIAED